MECSHCHRDFEQGVESAYKLGLMDGEARLKKTVDKILRNNNVLLNANQRLTHELLRLDQLYPLKNTPSVTITLKRAKQIIRRLTDKALKNYLIKVITEQLNTDI